MWGVGGAFALYFAFDYMNKYRKISPLSVDASDMKGVVDNLQKSTYQCRDYVTLENSFLLRPECSSIPSVADLAVVLNPGEFDRADIVFDFSVIPDQMLEDVLKPKDNNIGVVSIDNEPLEFDMNAIPAEDLASVLDDNRNLHSRAPTSLYIDTMDEDDEEHQNDYMYNIAMSLDTDEIMAALQEYEAASAQEFEQPTNMYDVNGEESEFDNPEFHNVDFDFDRLSKEEIEAALGLNDLQNASEIRPAKETRKPKKKSPAKGSASSSNSNGSTFRTPRSSTTATTAAARSAPSSSAKAKKGWKIAQPGGIKFDRK